MTKFITIKNCALGIFIGALVIFAVSCKVGPNYVTPKSNVADQWTGDSSATNQSPVNAEIYWWRNFDDPVLNQLIAGACSNNLSLQAAGVHILETRAQLNKSIGNLFPQQQGISGQLNYTRLDDGLVSQIPGINANYLADQVLFAATWEIDVWGKYRRGIESDRATFLGSIASYDDVMVTLIADVASAYVNIRTLQERLNVATRNLDLQKESLRIATARYHAGETGELDVQQAATQFAQTESQIPLLNEALAQNKNGLAILLGERPDQIDGQLTGAPQIPAAPTNVMVGIPKDLLRRRPDVREAGFQAAALSASIGVAKANLYPAFSLSGEFGFSANNEFNSSLADLFNWQSRALNAGAGLVMPVFNYGRIINQVRVQDAQFQQAVLKYQNTVLAAQQEVENGLASFSNERNALVSLNRAANSARRSTELAMVQYKGGQTDYTTVLTAEQSELTVENNAAVTKGNVALGLISVYRALGGGWEARGTNDVVSEAIKAEMSRRTDWGKMLEPSHHLPQTPPLADASETKGNSR
ncbi:MAG TPA: efflux transporter outer membrane subunit [Verrucomicrobiae bacterium]|nr:efflux transporter outer membrane subunit [Verrucomicrobiae bacterium]